MTWDYAELSKSAKEAGGPEALVDSIFESGKEEGHSEMRPWFIVVALGASALTLAVREMISRFKIKKKLPQNQETEKIKEELVQGIKDYDSEQAQLSASIEEGAGDDGVA